MKLTKYGRKEWLTATVIALPLFILFILAAVLMTGEAATAGLLLAILTLFVWIAAVGFFRDPKRVITEREDVLLSPADGVVRDIELISAADSPLLEPVFKGQDMLRIGIFLSVFDVHVNRAPCAMKVLLREHRDGKYLDARDVRAGKENESTVIGGTAEAAGFSFPIGIRQVSGAIARRIVCPVEPGTELQRGECYGMIKFGSRTELYLPAKNDFIEIRVRVGDRVQAGLTVMAELVKKQ